MSLLQQKKNQAKYTEDQLKILRFIKRRRLQILVHSCLYYHFDKSLIDDSLFDAWGKELAEYQNKYPDLASKVQYSKAFLDFDGSTGFNLPYMEMSHKAMDLWHIHERMKNG